MKNWQIAILGIPLGLLFAVGIPYVLSLLDRHFLEVELGMMRWIGMPLVAGGASFSIYSVIYLQRRCGGITAPKPSQPAAARLVDTGPYAIVRHPQQAGYLLLVLGMSIVISSTLALTYALLSTFLVVIEERLVEESRMLKRHGAKYVEYQRRVPQLVPRLRFSSLPRRRDGNHSG